MIVANHFSDQKYKVSHIQYIALMLVVNTILLTFDWNGNAEQSSHK